MKTKSFPRLYKIIFQARYKPKLKYYELLYPTVQKFENFPHWQTDRLSVVLKNFEKKCSLGILHNNFSYDQDSDSVSDEEFCLNKALTTIPENLKITTYIRIGYRRKYLLSVNMAFQELVEILHLKFFSQNEKLIKILPAKKYDLQYVLDFKEDNLYFHVRIGPVKKDEIPRHIGFNKDNHLDPISSQSDYNKICQSYPNVAIFFDIDIFRIGENIPSKDGLRFTEDSREKIIKIIKNLRDYIFLI